MARFEPKAKRDDAAPVISGIGESRTFNNPNADEQIDPFAHIKGCRMGGRPVEEVVPAAVAHLVTFDHTDEGIEARNAGKSDLRVSVTDDFDRVIEQRADAMEPWEAPDPVKEVCQQYIKPGQRARMLSEPVCDLKGLRGWQPVLKENGDKVRVGRSFLGFMPEEKARKREQYYRNLAREMETEAVEGYAEKQERFVRETVGRADIRPLAPGEAFRGRTAEGYGRASVAGDILTAPQGARIGLQSVRGNSKELEE